jgi:hypothetical protein
MLWKEFSDASRMCKLKLEPDAHKADQCIDFVAAQKFASKITLLGKNLLNGLLIGSLPSGALQYPEIFEWKILNNVIFTYRLQLL